MTASAADGRYISEAFTIGGGEEAGAPETGPAAKPNTIASDTYAKLARGQFRKERAPLQN